MNSTGICPVEFYIIDPALAVVASRTLPLSFTCIYGLHGAMSFNVHLPCSRVEHRGDPKVSSLGPPLTHVSLRLV